MAPLTRDRLIGFLNTAEGRDKFAKLLQFFARFFAGFFRDLLGYADLGKRFEIAWRSVLDARRVGWLLKTFGEVKTIEDTLANTKMAVEVRVLHSLARGSFAMRWIFENVMNMYRLKILHGRDWQYINSWAKKFWGSAVFFGILTELAKLRRLNMNLQINQQLNQQKSSNKKYESVVEDPQTVAARKKCYETLICHIGDMGVPAVIGFHRPWSDMRVGAGHFIAACIQCRNLLPAVVGK